MAEVAIVGVGGIAGSITAHLWLAGVRDIVLCARRPFDKLTVELPTQTLEIDVPATTDPASVTPAKWVFVATKAHQTAGAANWLSALCDASTRVVILQNGVEHRERVAGLTGDATVMPCMVQCPAELLEPGHVRVIGRTALTVANDDDGRALQAVFEGSPLTLNLSDDMTSALWTKLLLNAIGNSLCAVVGRPFGIFRTPEVADLARGILHEAIAVGRAEGAILPDDLVEKNVGLCVASPTQNKPSTLQDRLAGRPLEYDALNGVIVRLGKKHGIPTPLNTAMVALMMAADAQFD